MSIKKCFSDSKNKRLKELFDTTIDENLAAEKAINTYYSEVLTKLADLKGSESNVGNLISLPKNQEAKVINFEKQLTQRLEDINRKFYSKLDGLDDKYVSFLKNRPTETFITTEAKIKRLQEAFDAIVIVDTTLESSGVLLGSNHPVSQFNAKPTIAINPNKLFADTVIHEFGHLYIDMLGGMQDSVVAEAIELLKGSEVWHIVETNYPELTGEQLAKEVLATALGIEGDKVWKNNTEKKTLWDKIKAAILTFVNNLFGNKHSANALEQLATEMLTNDLRPVTTKFNNLIDQHSKYIVEKPTQDNIDAIFKDLRNNFELDEETHKYTDTSIDVTYPSSVSEFAKNISAGRNSSRKGSFNIEFDATYELTKETFLDTISQARLPFALDRALDDLFRNKIPGATATLTIKDNTYWHSHYVNKKTLDDINALLLDNMILENLDAINSRAYELQARQNIPAFAGNIVHNALENYVIDPEGFTLPSRIEDKSGKLLSTIKGIIDTGVKNGSKFYTEQILFSESAKKPGTADLIEITKDGKFRLYDYKTTSSFHETSGNLKSDWKMYIKPGYLHQLLIYSAILEEYGIKAADNHLNIVAIEVDRDKLSEEDPNSPLVVFDVIYKKIDPSSKVFNPHVTQANNTITSIFTHPNKIKEFNIKTEEKTIEDLIAKIQRGISDYKKLTNGYSGKFRLGSLSDENAIINKIEDDIQALDETQNKTAILHYLINIREALFTVYDNSLNKAGDITSDYISNLEFLVQASSFVEPIKEFVLSKQDDFLINDKDKKELLFLIKETEDILAQVDSFKDIKTRELTVALLSNHSKFMEGVWKEKFEIQGRAQGLKTKEELDEFIGKSLKRDIKKIQAKEYEYWNDLLVNGYTDLRSLDYLMADPGISSSQFVQVTKNVIDKVDQDVRTDLDSEIADLVSWHSNLKFKTSGDPEKVWGKFIEKSTHTTLDNKVVTMSHASVIPENTSDYREEFLRFKYQLEYLDREIMKAIKAKDTKKADKLKEQAIEVRDDRNEALGDEELSKEQRVHPDFAKLNNDEKAALRFIHKKLEDGDARLFNAPYKKLVTNTRDGGFIYSLPRKRKSFLETVYDGNGKWERFKSGLNEFLTPAKDEDELNISENEDTDFTDFRTSNTDILGDPLYDVPIYYRNQLENPALQSFDIPSLLADNDETTIMYQHHKMIEADLFMITNALKNSKAIKTDNFISNQVVDTIKGKLPKKLKSEGNKTLKAVQNSINNRFYKRSYQGTYSKLNYQFIKAGETLSKNTSRLLLAGNFGSASMTGIQGTIYRFIEGAAGEDFNLKDVAIGSKKAWQDINHILADSQKTFPTSKTALLIRRFGLDTEYKALVNKFIQTNFVTKNLDDSALFAITSIAETMVTANLMYTLMNNIRVMNSQGDFINNKGVVVDKKDAMTLDEAYITKDGKLELHKDVAFTDHNLISEFRNNLHGEKTIAATEISRFIRSKYADLFGQYNQDMKSTAEMHILGKLAFSMKKWLPRGYHRRMRGLTSVWTGYEDLRHDDNLQKRFFSQDQQKLQEGFYTTGTRFTIELFKELARKKMNFAGATTTTYNKLTTHERANLKRVGMEIAVIAGSIALAMLLRVITANADDDDRYTDAVYFGAYLAERIYLESATFVNPFELVNIAQNPAAAINTITRIQKLMENLVGLSYDKDLGEFDFAINDVYDKGERKDELKLVRNITGLIPYWKKVQQAKGIMGLDSKESIKDSYEYLIR